MLISGNSRVRKSSFFIVSCFTCTHFSAPLTYECTESTKYVYLVCTSEDLRVILDISIRLVILLQHFFFIFMALRH